MTEGIYRTRRPYLGECARVAWGAGPEAFLSRDLYEENGCRPRFVDLPTEEAYKRAIMSGISEAES